MKKACYQLSQYLEKETKGVKNAYEYMDTNEKKEKTTPASEWKRLLEVIKV